MLVIIRQQTGRLFVSGLYLLLSSPSALASYSLSLTRIKKIRPQWEQVKQANTTKAQSREPTPTLVWTRGQMNVSEFVRGQGIQTVIKRLQ